MAGRDLEKDRRILALSHSEVLCLGRICDS